jgi:AcrR family transcriptional regulator
MANRQSRGKKTDNSSPDRLIQAVLGAWATRGSAEISARALSEASGLPVSSIYYHFGSLEQLFVAAQDHARVAAQSWCEAQIAAISGGNFALDALPALLAALIDDWAEMQRRPAFAWREAQLQDARSASSSLGADRWQQLWADFWAAIAPHFGLSDEAGMLLDRFFDGESMFHMLRWRRTIDRAALAEFSQGVAAWLKGRLAPPAPWRDFARGESVIAMAPWQPRDETVQRIADAAADTLAMAGAAGVTHRAVAAAAGVTPGLVSYKFPTSAHLLRATFETIYARASPPSPGERAALPEGDRPGLIRELVWLGRSLPSKLATDELILAAARDGSLTPFAVQLRYLRGATTRHYLQAMLGRDRAISSLDAALLSGFTQGQTRAHFRKDEELRLAACAEEIATLLKSFG